MKRWLLIAVAAFATAGFTALGIWQVERRAWKVALIERVEQRIHAAPVAAPGPAEWAGLNRENAEYRRVSATGHFLEDRQTLVRAVTQFGGGFWLMEPLRTDQGFVVLINRGFVPAGWPNGETHAADAGPGSGAEETVSAARLGTERAASAARLGAGTQTAAPSATVSVTGLLRISEPHGAFLRANAPAENRWYSRDVEAISHAQHLSSAAPYFIDAEAAPGTRPDSTPPPVAGLTVVHFRNAHLQYAITWFILAVMALALGVRVARTR